MRVLATKATYYDVYEVRKNIAETEGIPVEDVLEEQAIKMIWEFIGEDFGDAYGVELVDDEGNFVR
jgi:hypothetical protein